MRYNPFGVPLAWANIGMCFYAIFAAIPDTCPRVWHAQFIGSLIAWAIGLLIAGTLIWWFSDITGRVLEWWKWYASIAHEREAMKHHD